VSSSQTVWFALVAAICRAQGIFMRKHRLAWVLLVAAVASFVGLSACGSSEDALSGSGGQSEEGGAAGELALGGAATTLGLAGAAGEAEGGEGGIAQAAGASTGGASTGGASTGGATGGASTGGVSAGGAASAGAAGKAGAASGGSAGGGGKAPVVDCGGACPSARPVCDTGTETCVECLADTDCKTGDKPGCLLSTHRCEDCSKSSQCPMDKPMCDVKKGQCQ
jgi:hypothetical protein